MVVTLLEELVDSRPTTPDQWRRDGPEKDTVSRAMNFSSLYVVDREGCVGPSIATCWKRCREKVEYS